jgi:hypothetical protein
MLLALGVIGFEESDLSVLLSATFDSLGLGLVTRDHELWMRDRASVLECPELVGPIDLIIVEDWLLVLSVQELLDSVMVLLSAPLSLLQVLLVHVLFVVNDTSLLLELLLLLLKEERVEHPEIFYCN